MLKRLLGLALTAYALTATGAAAQVELKSKAAEITLTGRVHLQWNSTSADEGDELSNELARARSA